MEKPRTVILVVEADPAQRDLARLALQRLDCEVVTANNGNDALRLFKKHQPSIIIMDILIPELNGLELLNQLKSAKLLKNTIVIITSALAFQEVILKAKDAGVWDFILKPYDVNVLVNRVKSLLKRGD